MNTPLWLLLGWMFHLTGVSAAPSSEEWDQYKQACKDEVHVHCIRQGIGLLNRSDVSNTRKAIVHGLMATAYLAIDQKSNARRSLEQMVQLAPCRTEPPAPLPSEVLQFFRKARRKVLAADQAPPVITHIPLNPEQLRTSGLFQAKITENLGMKQVLLHYRTKPKAPYQTQEFERVGKESYRYQMPKSQRSKIQFFQYYIEAQDCATQTSRAEAAIQRPFEVFLHAQGSSGRTIGGSVLTAVGAALLIGSVVAFISANSELVRWEATNNLARSEEIRTNIIILHSVGWSGVGVGLGMIGGGIYLLAAPPPKPQTSQRIQQSFRVPKPQRFNPNREANHATMVRIASE